MDRLGRRVLLITSSFGMLVACVGLTVSLYLSQAESNELLGLITIGFMLWYVTFFEIGLGPIPWLMVAEIFPSDVSATAMTMAAGLNWVANFFVGLAFPLIQSSLGVWTFVPFAIVLLLCLLFSSEWMPETRGKSVQAIQTELNTIWNQGVNSADDGMDGSFVDYRSEPDEMDDDFFA